MDDGHGQYTINKFCEFKNREIESEFLEQEKNNNHGIVRYLILAMGITFAMFAISDYYSYDLNQGPLPVSLGLRSAGLLIAIAAFYLVDKFQRYEHTLLLITITELVIFVIHLLNLYNQSGDHAMQFMSVMLFILAVFIIPNKWKNSLTSGFIIVVSYIIFCNFAQPHIGAPKITQLGIYMVISLVSYALFTYGRESSVRKHFATEKILEATSFTDRLTGIYNRSRFEHVLGFWIKSRRHDPFCLLFFDIDNFKKVNDNFGHNIGDEVLAKTAAVVSANIRDDDIFARWGGEEFVVLFSSVNKEKALELAERIRAAVENNDCGTAGKVTISIGVVLYKVEEGIEDFVRRADEKMYEAKRAGKNRVVSDI